MSCDAVAFSAMLWLAAANPVDKPAVTDQIQAPEAVVSREPGQSQQPAPPAPAEPTLPEASTDVPTVTPPPKSAAAPTESDKSPWASAADGGKTLGRKSKEAGVATAGAFSRMARRVAAAAR